MEFEGIMNEQQQHRPPLTRPLSLWRRPLIGVTTTIVAVVGVLVPSAVFATPQHATTGASVVATNTVVTEDETSVITRDEMTQIVDDLFQSMQDKDWESVPTAQLYKATENAHAASLEMMTSFRTFAEVDDAALLAIDTVNGQAYFATSASEGNDDTKAMLWGRIKVVDDEITELELYINRSRGDHGYSFGSTDLASVYYDVMNPPEDRVLATRDELETLAQAAYDTSVDFTPSVSSTCEFTENGTFVVDPGPDGTGRTTELNCVGMPSTRPVDLNARDDLVIDEDLGIVVVGAIVAGTVFGYGTESAFIPDSMTDAQEAEQEWIDNKLATDPDASILAPTPATGENLQVLQYYDSKLQAEQVNVYLTGPNETSAWTVDDDSDTGDDDSDTDDVTIDTTTAVTTRTIGSSQYLAVTVTNDSEVEADITVSTTYGDKTFSDVQPGASVSVLFNTKSSDTPTGTLTVAATGTVDGESVTTTNTITY
ncbi:MAG: hypothetical protein QM602_01340 [Microbacterium sp.]